MRRAPLCRPCHPHVTIPRIHHRKRRSSQADSPYLAVSVLIGSSRSFPAYFGPPPYDAESSGRPPADHRHSHIDLPVHFVEQKCGYPEMQSVTLSTLHPLLSARLFPSSSPPGLHLSSSSTPRSSLLPPFKLRLSSRPPASPPGETPPSTSLPLGMCPHDPPPPPPTEKLPSAAALPVTGSLGAAARGEAPDAKASGSDGAVLPSNTYSDDHFEGNDTLISNLLAIAMSQVTLTAQTLRTYPRSTRSHASSLPAGDAHDCTDAKTSWRKHANRRQGKTPKASGRKQPSSRPAQHKCVKRCGREVLAGEALLLSCHRRQRPGLGSGTRARRRGRQTRSLGDAEQNCLEIYIYI